MPPKSWQGDWRGRILARVRASGHDTLTAFADERPTATMSRLLEELGSDDINAAQLIKVLREEAEQGGTVERHLRQQLVRELHEAIPKGWGLDPGDGFDFEFKVASAFGHLATAIPDDQLERMRGIGRKMRAASIPTGWLPAGPSDPILLAFFADMPPS